MLLNCEKNTFELNFCRYTEAVIDNFAPIESQLFWKGEGQRYWINEQWWGGVGFPVFVYIGGEGEEKCSRLTNRMYAFNLAQQHEGLLVNVEHRFYGLSYPTSDMSTPNLAYLSSEQALADLARIIQNITVDRGTTSSKVITIGGSYPGNLAAWFKLKYPHVSAGSIASSAPLTSQTNFPEYMKVVADSIAYFSGSGCNDKFEAAAQKVQDLLAGGPGSSGWSELEKNFKTCNKMNSTDDATILLSDLMGNVQGTIQYNNEHNGVMNVTDICATMAAGSDPYRQFVVLASQYRTANGQTCEDASWADTVAILSDPAQNANNNGRPWTYQTCNEFGYFQTTDDATQPFHSWTLLDLDFYRRLCAQAFSGWSSDPQVAWMNQVYGDVRIAGTDILFPSGTIDPWHALGVTNSTPALPQSSETKVYIEGTAHCSDLYAPANSDPESLTFARMQISDQVTAWLS